MKRLLFIGALATLAIMGSCRKDYTCVCTEDGYTKEFEYTSIKKDDAESACEDQEEIFNKTGQNVVCKLD